MAAPLSEKDLALFRDKNFAHLTTLNPDGSPQTTVLWVDEADGRIMLNTAADRSKVANIRRDPRVAISVHSQENPYASIAITGQAQLDRNDAERRIDSLTSKFMGQETYPAEWRSPNEERVTIWIVPERIHRYGY